jgi:hypothetical protein
MAQPTPIATAKVTAATALDLAAPTAAALATSTASNTVDFPGSAKYVEATAGSQFDSSDGLMEELGFSGMGSLLAAPLESSMVGGQPLPAGVTSSVPARTYAQPDSDTGEAEARPLFGADTDSVLQYDGGAGDGLTRIGSWPDLDMLASGDTYDLGLLPDLLGPSGASTDAAVEVGGVGMPRSASLADLNFGD